MRTSLFIALAAALITTLIGVVAGVLAGYLGGWIDIAIMWVTDFALAMPFLIVALAIVPTVSLRFYGPREAEPQAFRVGVLILVFAVFGWTSARCGSANSSRRPAPAASAWDTCCSASCYPTSGRPSWSPSRLPCRPT
jgi:ABC-type microcin C transport system permease subunit YejE